MLGIILLEATLLALFGGFLGWLAGHLGCFALSPLIEDRTGVQIGFGLFEPSVPILQWLGIAGTETIRLPVELLLIPVLMLLAILVGIWPAISAYRTDVARSLGK